MTWEIFKKAFLDRFFQREKREANVEELINLLQGGMSVLDYSLKFTKLPKYAPSSVSDLRDEMSRFVMGVSHDLKEECYLAMLYYNMNTSHLMLHAQQVDDTRVNRKSRDSNREKSFDGGSSNGTLDIKDKPRFKMRFSNQAHSKFPKPRDDWVSNPKPKKGGVLIHQTRIQLMKSVARHIMVIASLGQIIALVVVRLSKG